MATYVNDLRLKEIATGDESGTWGTSTNTNLELIADAFSYATKDCFASDADATETMADGVADEIRSLYLKVTSSATLTATRTLTLAPNTVSKTWIIENATTGGQSISISQGSGANVTIPNGDTKIIYTDGAGAGAAVTDAFASLNVGDLTATNITGTLATAAQPNITSVGTLTGFTSTGIDDNATSTAITIDSSENVGIGVSSLVTGSSRRILQVSTGSDGGQLALADSTTEAANPRIFATGKVDLKLSTANTATGTIRFITGATPAERMIIDSSGNVGIGTTNPIGDLTVSNAGAEGIEFFAASGANINSTQHYNRSGAVYVTNKVIAADHQWFNGGTERMRIDSSGNVGIGTTSPTFSAGGGLNVAQGTFATIRARGGASTGVDFAQASDGKGYVYVRDNADLIFGTNNAERMRIDSSGNALFGCTALPSAGAGGAAFETGQSSGRSILQLGTTSTSNLALARFYNGNGSVGSITVSGSATAYNTSSDARLKDVKGKARGLEVINELNPVAYNWKADGKADEGLIAQEVLDIVPNAVSGSEKEMYQMDYSKLVVHLVAGMKEQQTIIESLEARITALES
jgi:hypothetical protein